MFDLKINGQPVIVKAGSTIRLTRENPLFEDAGDWTLDVVLPLAGCRENLSVFGNAIHRPEVGLSALVDSRYPFTLLSPPVHMEGTAVVVKVTDMEASVQLLGGKSAFKQSLLEAGEDVRLDDLDLGEVLQNVSWEQETVPVPAQICSNDLRLQQILAAYYMEEVTLAREHGVESGAVVQSGLPFSDPSEYDAAFAPIYSKADGAYINEKVIYAYFAADSALKWYKWLSPTAAYAPYILAGTAASPKFYSYPNGEYPFRPCAPMPFLLRVLEKVIAAMGYTVTGNTIRETWMERIVIANTVSTVRLNKMLPDWTVKEFLTECRYFFGIEYLVEGTSVRIVRPQAYYAAAPHVHIMQAADTTASDIDSGAEVKGIIGRANVNYADITMDAPMLSLPADIFSKANIESVLSTALVPPANEQSRATLYLHALPSYRYARVYAYLKGAEVSPGQREESLAEIDLLKPYVGHGDMYSAEARKADIEMRIRPCMMEWKGVSYVYDSETASGTTDQYVPYDGVEAPSVPVLVTERSASAAYSWTVDGEVNSGNVNAGTSDEEREASDTRTDILEVAYIDGLNGGGERFYAYPAAGMNPAVVFLPEGISILPDPESGLYKVSGSFGLPDRFSLTATADKTIGKDVFATAASVDTRLVRQFTFMDTLQSFDPTHIYIIRGRRYICQKIELTIDEHGLQKMKTGYFYELD